MGEVLSGKKVSERTIRRLSHYARCLRLARTRGDSIMTSGHLAGTCGISSAAVRKDLAFFGEFGKQGSGYDVDELLINIERILGTTDPPSVVVIGAGNIGMALIESGLAGTGGYTYGGIFDHDPSRIGLKCAGREVQSTDSLPSAVQSLGEVIAIIAVSPGAGQSAADIAVAAGCSALLSFTLEPLAVPEEVILGYVEVSTELDILTHSIRCRTRDR